MFDSNRISKLRRSVINSSARLCNRSRRCRFWHATQRLRSAVRRPHPPRRPVLGRIHCFRQCEIVGSQILLYGAQPCDAGASSWSLLSRAMLAVKCAQLSIYGMSRYSTFSRSFFDTHRLTTSSCSTCTSLSQSHSSPYL